MRKRVLLYLIFFSCASFLAGGWFYYKKYTNITYYNSSNLPPLANILKSLIVNSAQFSDISLFAETGGRIRQIAVADDGWVFLGSKADTVLAVKDTDADGKADITRVIAERLEVPHGVAYHNGDLYIGAIPTIYVIRDILPQLSSPTLPTLQPLIEGLPTSGRHGLRHIKVGPDSMLYVSFGVPCNICIPPSAEFTGVIRRYPLSGGDGEVYARGIRNAVGFDFHPRTKELWFTDNGRDLLGDDLPSDELNRVQKMGEHFGYPYCHESTLADPKFGDNAPCSNFSPPALLTGAHVANLGMVFSADGKKAYIALHGSWNRSKKVGYAVYQATLNDDSEVVQYEPFVTGWLLADENVLGRPADVAFYNDDSLLISDDFTGALYLVTKQTNATDTHQNRRRD